MSTLEHEHLVATGFACLAFLRVKPFEGIILCKDGSVHVIAIILDHFFGVNAMKLVLSLIKAAAVGAVLGGTKYANMDICVVRGGYFDLGKEMQTVCRDSDADTLQIRGREGG